MKNTEHNQLELENLFANNFKTPQFILLAQIYFESHDLDRAQKVCTIGLENHPENLDAQYLLAKIFLLKNKIIKSEQLLNTSFKKKIISIKMLKLLIEIRDSNNRSLVETKKIVDYLLTLQSDDAFGNRWIHNYNQINKSNSHSITKKEQIFTISPNIISYTFYNVLKNQKYYEQAAVVLNMLQDENQINSKIYKKESKAISELSNS